MPVEVLTATPAASMSACDGGSVGALRDAALAGPGFRVAPELAEQAGAGLMAVVSGGGVAGRAACALPRTAVLLTLLLACLFSGEGYDSVLGRAEGWRRMLAFPLTARPTAQAFSSARLREGEESMRELFAQGAAQAPALPERLLVSGRIVTAFDGTTFPLAREDRLAEAFDTAGEGGMPMARMVALVRCADRRVIAAEIGGYRTSEQALADALLGALSPGTINLADRNFYSLHRFSRAAATGADLLWRVKNSRNALPIAARRAVPDGSVLVTMRESDGMYRARRKAAPHTPIERLTVSARLIEFTIVSRRRDGKPGGRSRFRLLTTLLDHERWPARMLASLYSERWQIEITFLRIKKTLRGAGQRLRAHHPATVRQEIWAYLTVYNLLCDLALAAAVLDGVDPDAISFVNVLRAARDHLNRRHTACENCGHRQQPAQAALLERIQQADKNRQLRNRTAPRGTTGPQTSVEVRYAIEITAG